MKIAVRLTAFLLFAFLSCARGEPLPDLLKTYQVPTGSFSVSVDRSSVNPAERLTVSAETRREDGKLPVLTWSGDLPLRLLETYEAPAKTVYRFDSDVPGRYVLPRLKVAFPDEQEFFTDEIPVTVFSETESGTLPTEILPIQNDGEILPIQNDGTDLFLILMIVCAVVFVLLFAILIALLVRYRILKKRLKEAVDLQPLNILTALKEAVANRFDTLKTDQAAVLILRAVMLSVSDGEKTDGVMEQFPVGTLRKLREKTEKYQKIAFAQTPVTKIELTEDLNFFIAFQKEWIRLKNEEAAKK